MNIKTRQSVLSAGIITAVIFLLDLSLPPGVAIGVVYVTVLFLLPNSEKNKNILLFAAITSFLTLLAFFIKANWETDVTWKIYANRGISIFTIWVMAGLLIRYRLIQEENQEKSRKSEERFRSLVGSATDAIVTSDERGNILTWNHSAARIFGWSEEEVLGKAMSFIMPERFREMHEVGMRRYNATHEARVIGKTVELEGQRKDGSIFPVELSLGTWQMGGKSYFCGILRDITDRKRLEHDLEQSNKDLEQKVVERTIELETKNKEMEQFVYIASHDLQEPLRSVSDFAGLLKEQYRDHLDEDGEQYHRFIEEATSRMSNLIKSLLDYSRLGSNKVPVVVDCNKLMQDVRDDLFAVIGEKKAVLTVGDLPQLEGFEVELRLLFQNLVGNAIKFNRPGIPPEINIAASEDKGFWKFSVRDNGIGIDPKYHQKIFKIFQRLHANDSYEGTGIGLAHCKKIVELHGGKIWVESTLGEGSTFHFTIARRRK